ncbi:hypothetical protein KCP77_23975 [Salmonella enterica subsp. enterica]|nr:hypothetical protein KCP77_23975 [Salmonella enterica subsp. enterica]
MLLNEGGHFAEINFTSSPNPGYLLRLWQCCHLVVFCYFAYGGIGLSADWWINRRNRKKEFCERY